MTNEVDHIASRVSPVGVATLDTLSANAQQPRAFDALASRIGRWVCVTLVALTVAACAVPSNTALVEHGFDVRNVGAQSVSDAIVRYGDFVRAFCDRGIPCRKGYATFYGVYMPIQDSFTVTWKTADGQEHRAVIHVSGHLKDRGRLHAYALRFDGSALSVMQELRNSNTTDVKLETLPLYP